MPVISVVIPVVRPDGFKRCVSTLLDCERPEGHTLEVISEMDEKRKGCPTMVKELSDKCNGDYIVFLGDDTVPDYHFLTEALKVMHTFPDGWGLVGLNTGDGHNFATHWMGHKKLKETLGGYFFYPGYRHCYCDNELTDRAKMLGRFKFAEHSIIKHYNFFVDGVTAMDDHYRWAYNEDNLKHDRELYERRKKAEWETY